MNDNLPTHLMTRDQRLLDLSLMVNNEYVELALLPCNNMPLVRVFDKPSHTWTEFKGTLGELLDSLPITTEEAERFRQNGALTELMATMIAGVHLPLPKPNDVIPNLDVHVLQLPIKEAFNTFRNSLLFFELVRQRTGKELIHKLKGAEIKPEVEYPSTMTSEQSVVVGPLLDFLNRFMDFGDLLTVSQRLGHEAEITGQLDKLDTLGLEVFIGSYRIKMVLENNRSLWMRQPAIAILATNDTRIKRKPDGAEVITGTIRRTNHVIGESDAGLGESTNVNSIIAQMLAELIPSFNAMKAEFQKMNAAKPEKTIPSASALPKYQFKKVGDVWDVIFDGNPLFHMQNSLGAKYLDYLLHRPNQPISAYDLETAIQPEKAPRPKNITQEDTDTRARGEYIRELNRLQNEREKAKDNGDESKVDYLDTEIESIQITLEKKGQATDSGERARGNVSKAIAAARGKLLKGDCYEKAFGNHIQQCVNTGYECLYSQPQGRIWA